ncbi:GNAT family N-acetyltransferase [Actibacterium sp. XHP0104]|uniref:GNAT family N-acetyltransferase n=1 Tax=Actibacterium sp. XHP0104 TaxID=2984335 RepID=UPI0021E8E1F2|nr:GNAT family N-acetyltransferase [Actibacterium sp. XHP0104]MCV2882170.1 GNAT family N-acetyltransferase [Actibacterium sp. XHP0104]
MPKPAGGITRVLSHRDKAAVLAHLLRLDAEDRYMRFFAGITDNGIRRYVDGIDWKASVLIGHFSGARMVGLAELLPSGPRWQRGMELAVSVEPHWRGRGLGRHLCESALEKARARHMRCVRLLVLHENTAMLRMVRAMGAELSQEAGVVTALIRLKPDMQAMALAAMAWAESTIAQALHLPRRQGRLT